MRVGLIDVDGHGHFKKKGRVVYPNLALAKIAAYHKSVGDDVDWYDPMFSEGYDLVYQSKVFSFTPDYPYEVRAKKVLRGGTGYDMRAVLPVEIDDMQPDFTIYPDVPANTSYGFLTRGCPNKCPWCVVPKKEGGVRPYWDVERVANGRTNLVLMDNNILAAGDYAIEQLDKIIVNRYRVDFNQALDARLVTKEYAKRLAKIRWIHSRIRFGCDTEAQIRHCERAMEMINAHGFRGEFFLYTMIGGSNDFTECFNRVNHWHERLKRFRETYKGNAVYPYAQPYRDPSKREHSIPQWQLDMSRWCNNKTLFCASDFEDYEPRKGFFCREYLYKMYEL